MPSLSSNSVVILDGKAVLSKRRGSGRWQARFKVGGRNIQVTTKTEDLDEAKEAATDKYFEARSRAKLNLPPQSKRFRDVARMAIDRMEKDNAAGQGKSVYRDYIQAINKYLIPFFGTHHIDNIDYPLTQRFSIWRDQQMRKSPKGSTINTHNSALGRVFDEGLAHGYITQAQIPRTRKQKGTGRATAA